jgi:protein-S-isoprenylcysteine O-methyltransferase Ste14
MRLGESLSYYLIAVFTSLTENICFSYHEDLNSPMENWMPYLTLALLWLAYFVLHSLLAANRLKAFLKAKMGSAARYYRLLYNLVATITILPVLLYNALISRHLLLPASWKDILTVIGLILATYGILILRMAFRQYSLKDFLGFRQVKEGEQEEPFSRDGILAVVRHPLYTGGLLILLGFWIFSPTLANLVTVMMLTAYILIGIRLEENKLIEQYGEEYRQYQQEVPMLIPRPGSLKQLKK